MKQSRKVQRWINFLLVLTVFALTGFYAYKVYGGQNKIKSASEMNKMLFPVGKPYDWGSPPFPPESKIDFKLEKGSISAGDKRVQYMCSVPYPSQVVAQYYEKTLKENGWTKLTATAEANASALSNNNDLAGIMGGLYRMGNLSLAIHIFGGSKPNEASMFRLSVIMMPE